MTSVNASQPQHTPRFETLEPRLLLSGDVLVSEFMADNENSFTDGYERQPDWIELQNTTTSPIDLTGWKLVDGGNEWILPAVTLPAHAYLLVCATDETGQDPAGYWHIGFKLTSDGEYLALLNDSGTVVHQYTPAFPRQLEDISYGV
ncbi:MAG: lamin tail domain-containing protein, partial [Phycisphaerae bacterium]